MAEPIKVDLTDDELDLSVTVVEAARKQAMLHDSEAAKELSTIADELHKNQELSPIDWTTVLTTLLSMEELEFEPKSYSETVVRESACESIKEKVNPEEDIL